MGNKRRKYTKEFKQESVEFLLRSGKPASKVAAELGITQEIISRWSRDMKPIRRRHFRVREKQLKQN